MGKYFTLFDFGDKESINSYIVSSNRQFLINELKNLLSTSNITLVLSGINRLHSTLLCEEGFSYVQQSQRYVPMTTDFIKLLDNTPANVAKDGTRLVLQSLSLYNEMTALKSLDTKGRPEINDFVHGIPYEDGRSVLPLAISTNIVITMTADRLIDLVSLFIRYPLIFKSLSEEFRTLVPNELYSKIYQAATYVIQRDCQDSDPYYKHKMKDLNANNNVILLDSSNYAALAALASQNTESPEKKYASWGVNADTNSKKLVANVVGYSHTGILEHSRNTFAMQCSLAAYHQVIRHRLQNIRREPLNDITSDKVREFVIPDTIKNNERFNTKVTNLISLYKAFYNKYRKTVSYEFLMQFMLNSTSIKFVVSSNIRNDNIIFRDRLCYTAQNEIRELYLKKFTILYNIYPNLVKYGLPPCVTDGKCKEGKFTCGRISEVLEEYKKFV